VAPIVPRPRYRAARRGVLRRGRAPILARALKTALRPRARSRSLTSPTCTPSRSRPGRSRRTAASSRWSRWAWSRSAWGARSWCCPSRRRRPSPRTRRRPTRLRRAPRTRCPRPRPRSPCSRSHTPRSRLLASTQDKSSIEASAPAQRERQHRDVWRLCQRPMSQPGRARDPKPFGRAAASLPAGVAIPNPRLAIPPALRQRVAVNRPLLLRQLQRRAPRLRRARAPKGVPASLVPTSSERQPGTGLALVRSARSRSGRRSPPRSPA
jgi:hypothetical protein